VILGTKGRYAVTAMVELAVQGGEHPLPLADIARRQSIPLAYLEQIFARLRKSHLVRSVRGPGGGYLLARAAEEITVAEIIQAAEEPIRMTRCTKEAGGCTVPKAHCRTHDLWEGLSNQILLYLRSVSLAHVRDGKL
jgi:Rrf2 family iron-sulfur cluster assembly transcriptional regulator